MRNARKIRSMRATNANGHTIGMREIATIVKSNTFENSEKNCL